MPNEMDDIIAEAKALMIQVKRKAYCHFLMAESASHKNLTLGIFVTLFSSIVGTTIFTAMAEKDTQLWIQIGTGLMSLAAAVLAGFQTFFHFNENAQVNKNAATNYEKVGRHLDIFLLTYLPDTGKRTEGLAEYKLIMDELQKVKESSPTVPNSVYNKASAKHPD
jgi:hypothetical protein